MPCDQSKRSTAFRHSEKRVRQDARPIQGNHREVWAWRGRAGWTGWSAKQEWEEYSRKDRRTSRNMVSKRHLEASRNC